MPNPRRGGGGHLFQAGFLYSDKALFYISFMRSVISSLIMRVSLLFRSRMARPPIVDSRRRFAPNRLCTPLLCLSFEVYYVIIDYVVLPACAVFACPAFLEVPDFLQLPTILYS